MWRRITSHGSGRIGGAGGTAGHIAVGLGHSWTSTSSPACRSGRRARWFAGRRTGDGAANAGEQVGVAQADVGCAAARGKAQASSRRVAPGGDAAVLVGAHAAGAQHFDSIATRREVPQWPRRCYGCGSRKAEMKRSSGSPRKSWSFAPRDPRWSAADTRRQHHAMLRSRRVRGRQLIRRRLEE